MQQTLSWKVNSQDSYVPMLYEGIVVGFCKSAYANRITDTLNEEEKLLKALQMACYDLVAKAGGSTGSVDDLVRQYLSKAERPKRGIGAIALLLKERQTELDLPDEGFARFCDSFRLSPEELRTIYAGEEIESTQLAPLSRILGMSMDDLIAVWQGTRGE
jgi:hypothetical protein